MPRKSRRKPKYTRRKKTVINLVDLSQTYLQTAILTRAAFNTSPIEFITGQQSITNTKYQKVGQFQVAVGQTTTTGYQPRLNGSAITLPELFGLNTSSDNVGVGGMWDGGTPMEAIRNNIELNGGYFRPLVQTAVLNIGFSVGRKVLSKQLGISRKIIKAAGLNGMVRV